MDRLHHLRETLPLSLAAVGADAGVEFLVLDWASADGVAEWLRALRSPLIRAFRADSPRRWHHSRAKNTAHRLAAGDILVNLDADNWLTPGYLAALRAAFTRDRIVAHFRADAPDDCRGRIACRRADFLGAGGYREDLTGWGVEDGDLIQRLRRLGCAPVRIPAREARAVGHADSERTRHTRAGRIRRSHAHTARMMLAGISRGEWRANRGRSWGDEPVTPLSRNNRG